MLFRSADQRIGYLSEMMNWPGVLHADAEVMAKIAAAKAVGSHRAVCFMGLLQGCCGVYPG